MSTDVELQSQIESLLLNDSRLSSHPISVQIRDGNVTLSGDVQSHRRKLLAHQIVARTDGVEQVSNDLCVTPIEPKTDEKIADNVRAALSASADVTKETVQVTATGGKVTLQGAVSSVWESAVAEDITRGVRGVRDVVNLLLINVEIKVGDEELANSIKAAFRRMRDLKHTDLQVAVTAYSALISGRVGNRWQKDFAESVARQFEVLRVENAIQVDDTVPSPA